MLTKLREELAKIGEVLAQNVAARVGADYGRDENGRDIKLERIMANKEQSKLKKATRKRTTKAKTAEKG